MDEMTYEQYQEMIQNIKPDLKDCPLRSVLEIVQGKWSLRVLFELSKKDHLRFGELKKQIGDVTNTVLTNTLRSLEEAKLVERIQYNEIPPHVEYSLSEAGKQIYPVFIAMVKWGQKYITPKE